MRVTTRLGIPTHSALRRMNGIDIDGNQSRTLNRVRLLGEYSGNTVKLTWLADVTENP